MDGDSQHHFLPAAWLQHTLHSCMILSSLIVQPPVLQQDSIYISIVSHHAQADDCSACLYSVQTVYELQTLTH